MFPRTEPRKRGIEATAYRGRLNAVLRRATIAAIVLAACATRPFCAEQRDGRSLKVAVLRFEDVDWVDWQAAGRRAGYTVDRYDDVATAPLDKYHVVIIRAMGLRLRDEQVASLQRARRGGTQILMTSVSDDLSGKQITLSEEQLAAAHRYQRYGGVENLAGLLHYLAHEFVDGKVQVPPPVERLLSGFFHAGGRVFPTLAEYEAFLRTQRPSLPADASRVALIGALLRPYNELDRKPIEYLIQALEGRQVRVYPIFGGQTEALLDEAKPDLVITFPIGRVMQSGRAPDVFARLKCPCVAALTLSVPVEQWLADPRGLSGPLLDMTVTMPEMDGVIEPMAITARMPDEQGVRVRTVIPDRVERRLDLVLNWLKLRRKANSRKRVVIVYYKGPGVSSLSAGGLNVVPSLWNTLRRMEAEGYDLGDQLPKSPEALLDLIQKRGKTLGQWALGSYEEFVEAGQPELVPADQYARWFQQALSEKRQKDMLDLWGQIPGKQMVTLRDGNPCLVVSRIRLGNVVIMPQPTVGGGGDESASIHGTDKAPPHFYLGAYLWARYHFQADAIVHFGTHGSLEFTYGKSCCLSRDCWPDILMGDMPHVYLYVINNIGEALVAKRRAHAVIVSHLTPPFREATLYGDLAQLLDKMHAWDSAREPQLKEETAKTITRMVRSLDIAAEAGIAADGLASRLLTDDEIKRLHHHLHELRDQHITDGLHVIGRPLTEEQIHSTVAMMLSDQDRKTVLAATGLGDSHEAGDNRRQVVRELVDGVLRGEITPAQLFSSTELAAMRELQAGDKAAMDGTSPMRGMMGKRRKMPPTGGPPVANPAGGEAIPQDNKAKPPMGAAKPPSTAAGPSSRPEPSPAAPAARFAFWGKDAASRPKIRGDRQQQRLFLDVLDKITRYGDGLRQSPQLELERFMGALRGDFVPPSSGGDPLINPESVPTGRNLYGISAEHTPTEEAWRVGQRLANELLAQQKARSGHYPRRVAVTLWGGEFVRDRGTTIAEILYLIGARPVWSSRGLVDNVEVIPSRELGRPRIDVLVQTSGQFRDVAASRITLIDKAVQLVAALGDEPSANYVREDSAQAEKQLKTLGYKPQEAREYSTARIFGAAENRSYGTGIMGMVEKGDTWTDQRQIADRYVQNMGGIYRDGEHWGTYKKGLLEAQMQGTEVVVQPRSSNTWGPLSLDHVYEFMGGMTLAVRVKTGVDPAGYFSDLRTPGQAKLTTTLGAMREEARTTLWNPKFLQGLQREGPQAAASLTKTVRNMYGWTVMQPASVSREMWDETYRVLIDDKHGLGMREYFRQKNPQALQDMTSVMLETARKGYWKPSAEMLRNLTQTHAELVAKFGAGCSYDTCGNRKLQEFVQQELRAPGSRAAPGLVASYQASLASALKPSRLLPEVKGIQLAKIPAVAVPSPAQPAAPKPAAAPSAPSVAQPVPKPTPAKPASEARDSRPASPPSPAPKAVEGFQMEEAKGGDHPSVAVNYWYLGGLLLSLMLFALGWWRPRT